jgi:hypothetical protein
MTKEVVPVPDKQAIRSLTVQIYNGLENSSEIAIGETILVHDGGVLQAFAVCRTGAGTEGGSQLCYVKFGAARDGTSFDRLLDACEAFAASRGLPLEAGVPMLT